MTETPHSQCPDCCEGDLFYLSSEDIYNDLFAYFVKAPSSGAFTETLYHVSVTFADENDDVCRYRFEKKASIPCPGQECGCSCLTEGRFRRLEILSKEGDEKVMMSAIGFDLYLFERSIGGLDYLNSSKIEFQSCGEHCQKFSMTTKLIWCWCKNRLVIGEFVGTARKQELVAQPFQQHYNSALSEIFGASSL